MKKLFLTMLGVSAMLCSTSCSDESIAPVSEGEAMVQFAIELDGVNASRAVSDGTTVNTVYYEVWGTKNNVYQIISDLKDTAVIADKQATINLALVKGQTYDIVFWASKAGVYNTDDLTNITVNEGVANDETKDAFTFKKTYTVTGPIKETVVLTRPFAQINFGTPLADMQAAEAAGAVLTVSKINVTNLAHSYNALTEEGVVADGAEPQAVEFGYYNIPDRNTQELTLKNSAATYEYLATAYVLFPGKADAQVTTDLTMTVDTKLNQEVVLSVPNAPAQRNYRTNILGNLLTNQADFEVVVDSDFVDDYPNTAEQELIFAAALGGTYNMTETMTVPYLQVGGDFNLNIEEDVTLTTGSPANYGIIVNNGTTTINGEGNISSLGGGIGVVNGASVVFNGGNLDINTTSTSGRYLFYLEGEGSTATINGGNFDFNKTQNQKRAYIYAGAGTTVYVKGGTFGKASTRNDYKAGIMGDGTVIITGGTFGFDPTAWVAEGYSVLKEGSVYVVGKATATVEELKDALNEESTVNITEAIDNGSNAITVSNNDVVINMENKEVKAGGNGTNNYAFHLYGSNVEVNDANINGAGFAVMDESSVTVNSGAIAATPGKSGRNMFYVTGNSTVTVNEGTYTFDHTSCYFVYVEAGSTCYINGGHFEKPLANNASKDSFVNTASTGTVIITGGTFNVDPTAWVAEGYKAVKEGKIWTVSAE